MIPVAMMLSSLLVTSAHLEPDPISLGKVISKPLVGLGIQWDPYEYPLTEAKWRETEKRVAALHLGFIRLNVNHSFYHSGFDASGKIVYTWESGKTNQRLQDVERILRFAQRNKINVILGQWGPPGKIGGEYLGVDDSRSIEMFATFLKHFRERFACIKWANYINEPNGDWSGNPNYETWMRGIKKLRAAMDGRDLKSVQLIGPDATGNTQWRDPFQWVKWVARDLSKEVDTYDFHWYALEDELRSGAIETALREMRTQAEAADPIKGKTFFLGEAGLLTGKTNGDQQPRVKTFEYGLLMADMIGQVYRAGWQGLIGWDLDDAMHVNEGPATQPPGPKTLKVWGMWNSQGAEMGNPSDFAPRPWYSAWRLASQCFPPGSQIVEVRGVPSGLRIVGAKVGSEYSFMAVNLSDQESKFTLPAEVSKLYRYDFSQERSSGVGISTPPSAEVKVASRSAVFLTPSRF